MVCSGGRRPLVCLVRDFYKVVRYMSTVLFYREEGWEDLP